MAEPAALPAGRKPEKDFITAVCDYRQESVRAVVKAAKYDGSRTALALMGARLAEVALEICREERIFADKIVIVAVPMTRRKRQERGFNQSRRIAQAMVAADQGETFVMANCLEKTRKTADQTTLSRGERQKNLAGAFRVKSGAEITAEAMIVIDDVTTTGATLEEARRALRKKTNAQIIGLAFAH